MSDNVQKSVDTDGKQNRPSPLTKGIGKTKKNKSQINVVKGKLFNI